VIVNPGAIVGEGFGAKGTIWDGLKTLLFYVATHWGRISAEIEEYRKRLQDQKGLEDEEKVGVIPHDDVRPDPDEVKPPKKEKGLFITEAIAMEREECAKIADRHDKTIGEAIRARGKKVS